MGSTATTRMVARSCDLTLFSVTRYIRRAEGLGDHRCIPRGGHVLSGSVLFEDRVENGVGSGSAKRSRRAQSRWTAGGRAVLRHPFANLVHALAVDGIQQALGVQRERFAGGQLRLREQTR